MNSRPCPNWSKRIGHVDQKIKKVKTPYLSSAQYNIGDGRKEGDGTREDYLTYILQLINAKTLNYSCHFVGTTRQPLPVANS